MHKHAGIDYYFSPYPLGPILIAKKMRFDKDLLVGMCSSVQQFLYSVRG